ncbi:MAG: hypothetical protein QM800_02145 [Paludibacter sp.]
MKKLYILLFCFGFILNLAAQAPDAFRYQAVVKNSNDESAFAGANVKFRFEIFKSASRKRRRNKDLFRTA